MGPDMNPNRQRINDSSDEQRYLQEHTSGPLSHHFGVSHSARDFSFHAPRPSQSSYILDDFDKSVLHDGSPRTYEPATPRFTLPPRSLYSRERPVIPSSLLTNTPNHQWHPINALPVFGDTHTRFHPDRGDPRLQSLVLPEPTAFFHGISDSMQRHLERQSPTPPRKIAQYAFTPPTLSSQSPPSTHEVSSPTNRISLRRVSNRPPLPTPRNSLSYMDEVPPNAPGAEIVGTLPRPTPTTLSLAHAPPIAHGIQLVTPYELPDRFRHVFEYPLFNAVQSKCFQSIYRTNDNVVISAPTGSGKTAILELAICKLVESFGTDEFKIVYQAPTKALCAERVRDWQKKFSQMNLPCAELTGDTDISEMRKVGKAAIIVTTPEKWDSITRKWKDYIKLLRMVKLFLIDEVHILKYVRGATLEAVVSRMKSIGASVRFIALSATVPNSQDIATWLGKDHTNGHIPAHREIFGEDFRPVKLQKHVYGFEGNTNDFAFDSLLDGKLPGLIAKHTMKKPMMVFCFTRKSCEKTAESLAAWWSGLRVTERPWPAPTQTTAVGCSELQELVARGVSFHHAGLDALDRAAIETGFLRGQISVICCTSTLAVGINLPCQLVVIKNTICYSDGGLMECSDLEVMQMLGRAGRPQFDKTAIAIIMTRLDKVDKYKRMLSGQEVLESTLHLHLIEHLNSEIGLGTVSNLYSAKQWLAGTFLSVRMRQNPTYYKFTCDTGSTDADERLERICEKEIKLLQYTNLVTDDKHFRCTEYGEAMSRYMVSFETMKLLLSIPKQAKIPQILHIICQASEFKDLRMKANERICFREFNKSPFIKSPIKENISTYAHKVSLIIQIQLGGVDPPTDKDFNTIRRQYLTEKTIVFDRIQRLIKCVVDCKSHDQDAVSTHNALELARSISAEYWEHSPLQLKQISGIGSAALRKLVQGNVKTIAQLASLDSASVERILSRNPPFGKKILDLVDNHPQLTLNAEITKILKSGTPVRVQIKARLGLANAKVPYFQHRALSLTFLAEVSSGRLGHHWRGSIKKLEKALDFTFTCELSDPEDTVTCQLACDELVGTVQAVVLKPDIPASAFPPSKLTPRADIQRVSNEDADFEWDDNEEADFLAALTSAEGEHVVEQGGSYDGDDDFVDIDLFDEEGDIVMPEDNSTERLEPIQLPNGKWTCNHRCSDGRETKNGNTCKHRCCRDGTEKPRKAKKRNEGSNTKTMKPTMKHVQNSAGNASKDSSFPKLKLANPSDIQYEEVEEIDLSNDPPTATPTSFSNKTPHVFRKLYDLHEKIGVEGSFRLPRQPSSTVYAGGTKSDLSSIHGSGGRDIGERDECHFPSDLLEDTFDYDDEVSVKISEPSLPKVNNNSSYDKACGQTPHALEGSASDIFDFKALEFEPKLSPPSKRDAASSPSGPDAKRARHAEEIPERALPSWVSEVDADLIRYFEGSVEFV